MGLLWWGGAVGGGNIGPDGARRRRGRAGVALEAARAERGRRPRSHCRDPSRRWDNGGKRCARSPSKAARSATPEGRPWSSRGRESGASPSTRRRSVRLIPASARSRTTERHAARSSALRGSSKPSLSASAPIWQPSPPPSGARAVRRARTGTWSAGWTSSGSSLGGVVEGVEDAVYVSSAFEPTRACAVTRDGGLRCWQLDAHFTIGGQPAHVIWKTEPRFVAKPYLEGMHVDEVAVDSMHTCARVGTKVYCWGDNYWGELCDGTTRGSGDAGAGARHLQRRRRCRRREPDMHHPGERRRGLLRDAKAILTCELTHRLRVRGGLIERVVRPGRW